MSEARPRYTVWIDAPAGWVPIPAVGTDPGPWAAETAQQFWDAAAPVRATPGAIADTAAVLAARARDCQTRTWIHALFRLTSPDAPPAMTAELQLLVPDGPDDPFTVEAFSAALAKRNRRAVVNREQLPAGPAVRCLRPTRGPREGLRRPTLTQVVHGIFPPQLQREGLVLVTTGTGLTRGSPALAEVDELATRISVEILA
ncbi:hypothetical protein [Sporichthya polymorpha]|uniref:hypothetical protein n=1 Tax=Sporichthya polymorpha TaxID=35751 RepID=UPI0012ECB0A2|nr:hypothetical protein [Sporichthya polymorpha]